MASTVYSTRFIAAALEPAGLYYTVPEGFVAVVRDIDAVGTGGEYIQAALETVGSTFWLDYFPESGSYGWIGWRGRQICQPGEQISVFVSGTESGGTVAVSGYLLTLP